MPTKCGLPAGFFLVLAGLQVGSKAGFASHPASLQVRNAKKCQESFQNHQTDLTRSAAA